MDFEVTYTEEQQRFRREVRAWLEANVPAAVQRTPTSPEDNYQRYLELRALGRKLGGKGWLYPTAPAKYGGGGLDVDHAIILEEEVDRFDLSLPPYYDSGGRLGSASILVWGTEEQRQAFLPPIYRGEVRTWQLLTEPGAGSDLAGVRMTTAVRDGDDYVIKGQNLRRQRQRRRPHLADRLHGAERPAPRESLVVHDRRESSGHQHAADGADGHGRRGRDRQRSQANGVLRRRAGAGIRAGRRREQGLDGRDDAPRARARRRRPDRSQSSVGPAAALLPGDQAGRGGAQSA